MDKKKLFKFCFGCSPEEIEENIIVTPFLPIKKFGEYCNIIKRHRGKMYSAAVAEKGGDRFSIICCGIGDRLLGDAVLLLGQTRAKRMIFTGSCASLCDAEIGDLIVGKGAFGGEGFTQYHGPDADTKGLINKAPFVPADDVLTKKLVEFVGSKVHVTSGNIFTIGSILAETKKFIAELKDRGLDAVEMELSAVYQAAIVAGISATSLLWISDHLMKRPFWEERSSDEIKASGNGIENAICFSMDFIKGGV